MHPVSLAAGASRVARPRPGSHSKCVDQRLERGRLMTPARVVEEVAVEGRTPVLEDPHELAACEVLGDVLLAM